MVRRITNTEGIVAVDCKVNWYKTYFIKNYFDIDCCRAKNLSPSSLSVKLISNLDMLAYTDYGVISKLDC